MSTIPILPLTLVQSLERRLATSVALATSPFTGTSQVQDWGGAWWEYELEMAVTQGAPARQLSAFFAALGGVRGRFLLRDPSHLPPLGGGVPYVTEVPADRHTLRTAGWGLGVGAGTRLTDPRKLDLLMALVALALGWAGRAAADLLGKCAPPRKSHGHFAKSWFRTGFDHIRNRLRYSPLDAIATWHRITPQQQKFGRVV